MSGGHDVSFTSIEARCELFFDMAWAGVEIAWPAYLFVPNYLARSS